MAYAGGSIEELGGANDFEARHRFIKGKFANPGSFAGIIGSYEKIADGEVTGPSDGFDEAGRGLGLNRLDPIASRQADQ